MNLGEYLLRAYGNTPSQNAVAPTHPQRIRVDDRDNDPAFEFCEIEVIIPTPESMEFELHLSRIPYDAEIAELAEELGGRWGGSPPLPHLTIPMHVRSAEDICRFAEATKRVLAAGKRYEVRNWIRTNPRTAAFLMKLARTLDQYRREYAPKWKPTRVTPESEEEWEEESEMWMP